MNQHSYFSDRERGTRARIEEEISDKVWAGLYQLIHKRINDGSFGLHFPVMCDDGKGPCGADKISFDLALQAEIPGVSEPLRSGEKPDDITILDILEFCAKYIAKPIKGRWHSYFDHYHLSFEEEEGLQDFVSCVNLLFARNGIAFELTPEGRAQRFGPSGFREELKQAIFKTGDAETDRLLEYARIHILSPKVDDHQDALEKLWDAFERIKTLEPGSKAQAVTALLNHTASPTTTPKLRGLLETEAKALTEIGNNFRIRHSETTQEQLQGTNEMDYLFHRMFSFIRLLLKSTGRGG